MRPDTLLNLLMRIVKNKLLPNKISCLLIFSIIILFIKYLINKEIIDETFELYFADVNYVSSEQRFIMYRCDSKVDFHDCGGLGDRLKGILSAYVWGLITNRTLVIKINRPCNLINLLQPNEVNWNLNLDNKIPREDIVELYKYGKDAFKVRLAQIDFTLIGQTKKLIVLHTNRNYAETIGRNSIPKIQNRLKELNLDASKLDLPYTFKMFYNKLFKLAPSLQEKYDKFLLRAKPFPNSKLICAQVRVGGSQHYYKKYNDLVSQPVNNSKIYWNLIKEKFISQLNHSENYKIFLTTDNELVHRAAIDEFSEDKLVYNDGPFNHIDYIKHSENDCSSSEKAILDFHVLQNCDMAVISRSQFGRMGVWNRDNPASNVYAYNTDKKIL